MAGYTAAYDVQNASPRHVALSPWASLLRRAILCYTPIDGHASRSILFVGPGPAYPKASTQNKEETVTSDKVDMKNLLPSTSTYYNWSGSLTTPPCTEGVDWNMMKDPIKISSTQLSTFQKLYSNNYRPVQALNGRTISENQ